MTKSWLGLSSLLKSARLRHRVPVYQQFNAVECGAACLAMILSYHGRKTSVAECRLHCGVGRDGVSARTIATAARKFGLRVKAYSLELPVLKEVQLPAIAHWNFNHFVVLEKWSADRIKIVDPGRGRCKITHEEFDSSFTGVILTFEPGVNFKPQDSNRGTYWRRYLGSMLTTSGVKGVLIQILLASLLLQILGLTLPMLTKIIVDQILPFRITSTMTILAIGIGILVLAQIVTSYLRGLLLLYLRGRLDSHLMLGFFEHLLSLPFAFFQQRTSGDLLMRLGSNSLIREVFTNQTISVLLDGSFVTVYLFVLLALSPVYAAIVVGLAAVQIAIVLGTRRRVRDLTQRELSARAEEQGYLVEAMKGIALLKASGAEDAAFDRWSNLFFSQLNVSLDRSCLSARIEAAMGGLRTLSPLLMLWVGSVRVLDGSTSLGTMLALNALGVSCLAPLALLMGSAQQLQMVGAQLDRIADVLEAEPEEDHKKKRMQTRLQGRIEVDRISFRYSENAPLVLRDVYFRVEPGQKLALVGPTASGKSTLAMLLLGLYQPSSGEIRYDGMAIQDFDYRSLRGQIGVVLQDSFLFSGSIRQNIALCSPGLAFEHVVEAARVAAIHDEIARLPMAYETIVAEGGTTLSGGQRQRIALARALVRNPAVLILDEATSHLDVGTEFEVYRNLSTLSCTRIIIAHRLSTIKNADQILVLNEGTIVERGTYDDLMNRQGQFATLIRSQAEKHEVEVISKSSRESPTGLESSTMASVFSIFPCEKR